MEYDRYSYRVDWFPKNKQYVGTCIEFPSLSWFDESAIKALRGIRSVVHNIVAEMVFTDEAAPEPISLLKKDEKMKTYEQHVEELSKKLKDLNAAIFLAKKAGLNLTIYCNDLSSVDYEFVAPNSIVEITIHRNI